jgi:hypothetical protein
MDRRGDTNTARVGFLRNQAKQAAVGQGEGITEAILVVRPKSQDT